MQTIYAQLFFRKQFCTEMNILKKYVVGIRAAGFQKRQHTQKKTTHGRCQNYRDIFLVIFLFNSSPQKCSLFVPYPWPQFGETPQKKPSRSQKKYHELTHFLGQCFLISYLLNPCV